MYNIYNLIQNNETNMPAIIDGKEIVTYRELIEFCNRFSSCFANTLKKGDIVLLYGNKSSQYLCVMIALIKMGVVYIPLDNFSPPNRVMHIAQDVSASFVFADKHYEMEKCITFDELWSKMSDCVNLLDNCNVHKKEESESYVAASDLVYMITTSGTTGVPKYVMIEHHNLLNLIDSLNCRIYKPIFEERILHIAVVAAFSFDASVKQIFFALCNGHTLVICHDFDKRFGRHMLSFLKKYDIDAFDVTPSLLSSFLFDKKITPINYKGLILVGGENLLGKHITEARKMFGQEATLVNVYGPTECCVDVSYHIIDGNMMNLDKNEPIPIGIPIDNVELSISEEGELVVYGECVGRGYYLPVQNNGFEIDALGKRCYRTGDFCRSEGNLYYIEGRCDDQIKTKGFRIELGQIDNEIQKIPGVKYSCTFVRIDGDKKSIYSVIMSNCSDEDIRKALKSTLPKYMIPQVIINSTDRPVLTKSGKIDRNFYIKNSVLGNKKL